MPVEHGRWRSVERRTVLWVAAGGIAVAVVAVAALSTPPDGSGAGGGAANRTAAPDLELTDFKGRGFSLADYEGTPVVLNFWASWCPPCSAEMPDFEQVHQRAGDKVAFVGVNLRDDPSAAEKLARETGVTYRLVSDPSGRLFDAFGAPGMPTTAFIDASGNVVEVVPGQLSQELLRRHITRSLGVSFDESAGSDDKAGFDVTNVATQPIRSSEPLIDPEKLVSGGPPPDGIPPIDDPRFQQASDVNWLASEEPVIAVELNGEARAYPLQILTWHEIVNDELGGTPIAVTFCPLCNTPYVFEQPTVDGEVTTFGTSGRLYNSNLVMYDRATNSFWPQAMGRAVLGSLTGATLRRVPSQIVAWAEFRAAFPDAEVLSRDTGYDRPYGENPYVGYDDIAEQPWLFEGEVDGRLAPVERVLGVEGDGEIVAFPYFRLQKQGHDGRAAVNATVGNEPVVILWQKGTTSALDDEDIATSADVGAAAAFSRLVGDRALSFEVTKRGFVDRETGTRWDLFGRASDGPLERRRLSDVDAHDSFWFDWAAFHPDTKLWPGE